jgi:hypothetical protein
MHFTPTAALEVILILPPLGIYIEGEIEEMRLIAFGRRFLV